MSFAKKIASLLRIPLIRHLLFWLGIFSYFLITLEAAYFSSYYQGVESRLIMLLVQIITAYTTLYILMPYFLTPKKYIQFSIYLLLLLFFNYTLYVCIQEFYHLPKYFNNPQSTTGYDSIKGFWDHIFKVQTFTGKSVKFLTPTIILLTIKFYNERQTYLKVNEQKKTTELTTLKHQLNPHFLFNTLNNLYALTIEKSDEAPEVIAKLSEMLDYMLYGCNEEFADLQKEVELIKNYLALEKVRYGTRVSIQFNAPKSSNAKIAPLILLTFIENAFKHGVSQELNKAFININIVLKEECIHFKIENSIAANKIPARKESIGISNVKKQLELLYANTYALDINEESDNFYVDLKIPMK
ncbi:histidine kinase [uncultured Tenacibaculum sp.]|uniref:sensor histidine kinase n=1 Tax=uncultured Tenacibaculum sp. TaxID=174713 RepID=UPI00260D43E6|nr:histidine kinase [uncultured Tenacibaculum sp.]